MEKPKYYCEMCDFSAVKLCHWKDHLSTKKHSQQNFPAAEFYCDYCDVKCGHMSSMERHKKTKKHIEAAKKSGQTETKYLDMISKLLLDNQRTNNDNRGGAWKNKRKIITRNLRCGKQWSNTYRLS